MSVHLLFDVLYVLDVSFLELLDRRFVLFFKLLLHQQLICKPIVAVLHLVYMLHILISQSEGFRFECKAYRVLRVWSSITSSIHFIFGAFQLLIELQSVTFFHNIVDSILESIQVIILSNLGQLMDQLCVCLRLRLLQCNLLFKIFQLFLGNLSTVHLQICYSFSKKWRIRIKPELIDRSYVLYWFQIIVNPYIGFAQRLVHGLLLSKLRVWAYIPSAICLLQSNLRRRQFELRKVGV